MRRAALVLAVLIALPAATLGWGFEAHRFIADRMIALLPAELRPFFESRRAFIVERAVDPDLWRNVGWDDEPPNHFLDLDSGKYGDFPFNELPREYDRAVQKFGVSVVRTEGTLPWRVAEFHGRLEREFTSLKQKTPPTYVLDNIALYSAVLAHYVGDAHVPLHASANYDGGKTGQSGVHSRWEADLFERNRARLTIAPKPIAPVRDPREFTFGALLDSAKLVGNVLESDKKAAEGREFYDDGYFDAFGKGTLPVLERRLNESIAGVAATITGAWEQAGKPAVPVQLARTPRAIRRPK